jgi:FAD/FMN-containing dehydrogenase
MTEIGHSASTRPFDRANDSTADGRRMVSSGAIRTRVESWGRLAAPEHICFRPAFADQLIAALLAEANRPVLCRGLGRSYGDVASNAGGCLIGTVGVDHLLHADWQAGTIRAESGLSLDALLEACVPRGWFPPVIPGTKFVTLGGAVANDVHGKNHGQAGTFGSHVRRMALARSTGEILELSTDSNRDLFTATIGGLGLTGIILWVELQLMPIRSAYFDTETVAMTRLDQFFRLAQESADWPYMACWIDGLASSTCGVFVRGRHADHGPLVPHARPRWRLPVAPPRHLLNSWTVRLFNAAYRNDPRRGGRAVVHYDQFLCPLDSIASWNRFYGPQGFFQHQSAVPMATAPTAVADLLQATLAAREAPYLTVLKPFASKPSPGTMSFPREGATLAMDFPNRGPSTRRLLRRLSDIVIAAGGRIYPAKDATMAPEAFQAAYPGWRTLEHHRDPAIMSDFWRRVTGIAA